MLTNLVFVVLPAMVLAALTVRVSRSWPMPLPAIGVFDRTDVVLTAAVIVVFPVVGVLLPPWGAALVFSAIVVNAWYDMGWRLCPQAAVRVAVGCGAVATSLLLRAHGWHWAWLFNDVILAVTVVAIVAVWVQTGMTLGQVSALAVFLTAYDLISTHLTTATRDLLDGLLDGALPFTFVLEVQGHHFQLGFGDVLVMSALTAAAFAAHPRGLALGCSAAVFAGLTGAMWFAVTHPRSHVAVMTFVGPAAVLAAVAAAALDRRPIRATAPAAAAPA